jgi:hypothetical protein
MKVSPSCVERLKRQSVVRSVQEPLRCEHDRFEYELFDLDLFAENMIKECVAIIQQTTSEDIAERVTRALAAHFAG